MTVPAVCEEAVFRDGFGRVELSALYAEGVQVPVPVHVEQRCAPAHQLGEVEGLAVARAVLEDQTPGTSLFPKPGVGRGSLLDLLSLTTGR